MGKITAVETRDAVRVPRVGLPRGEPTNYVDSARYAGVVFREHAAGVEMERDGFVSVIPWSNVVQVAMEPEAPKLKSVAAAGK